MKLKDIPNFHKVKQLKLADDYIKYYEEVGIKNFIDDVRASGILINSYDAKWTKEKLVGKITEHIKKKDMVQIQEWQELIKESKIINELYSELYGMDLYKKAENVPKEKAFTSFVIILEKFLSSIINEINGDESKNDELSFNFYSDFAFDSKKTSIEKNIDVYEHIILVSDMILKYLLFFKCKDVLHDLETTDENQRDSFAHLEMADKKSVIQSIDKEWSYLGRKIVKNGSCIESYCDSKELLDYHIVTNRILSRKNKILRDLQIGEDATGIISKEAGISNDEKSSILFLKNILNIDNLSYKCYINKRNGELCEVILKELVRAYAVIKKMNDEFIVNKQKFSNSILDVCLILDKDDIISEFEKNEISNENAQEIIKALTYESYKDIFDTPLISYNEKILLIPSIIKQMDIAQVVLSCVNQFNFQGEAFEKTIISILQKAGINAINKKYRDESGEYQCDVLFGIKKTLFVCECKAWGEPLSINAYCERNEKCFDAYKQINRIAQKYEDKKDEISNELGMKEGITRIKKVVLLSNAVGIENRINEVYYIDYSSFYNFIERKKPSINAYHNKTIYYHELRGFEEFEGTITENKLEKCFTKSSSVQLMLKNIDKQVRVMPLKEYTLKYDTYILKENDVCMPDRDVDDYLNSIEKIYPVNNKKR